MVCWVMFSSFEVRVGDDKAIRGGLNVRLINTKNAVNKIVLVP